MSSAEQFEADSEVEAALFDLCEAVADGSSVSAQELSTLVSAGLEADPAVAVSLLSAVVGQDAARMGQLAAPDDLHTYAIIVSNIVQDLGLNSIEFQQDVQQGFQQSTGHSVKLNTLLKILLNRLLKFN